ncbi:MAG: hypothetical protein Q7R97_00505 [Candidatus Daviesbacteria bacterium]|nr:hypothetical protein [Candidatus Daviesbacteria bacterium]
MDEERKLGTTQKEVLDSLPLNEVIAYLQQRVADSSVDEMAQTQLTTLIDQVNKRLQQVKLASTERAGQNWLEKIKKQVLVARRTCYSPRGYINGPDVYPNTDRLRGKITSREWMYAFPPNPAKILYAAHKIRLESDIEARKFYPAIVVSDIMVGTELLTVLNMVNINPHDSAAVNNLALYFDRPVGKELAQALENGEAKPNIFLSIYDFYYPKPRHELENLVSGRDTKVFLMQGVHIGEGGRTVIDNPKVTELPLKHNQF